MLAVLAIFLSLVFILFVYRRYNKHNETSNTNNANNLARPRQQNNLRNDRNTGVYEPISGQSYPRPVSNVTSTSNNSIFKRITHEYFIQSTILPR
jgi:cbb3-type cytochrome oxidase subunit 3